MSYVILCNMCQFCSSEREGGPGGGGESTDSRDPFEFLIAKLPKSSNRIL